MNKINKNHVNEIKGTLKDIFEAELAAGNTVKETSKGGFSNSDSIVIVALSKPFLTPVKKILKAFIFRI